jgi:hypothetical protein
LYVGMMTSARANDTCKNRGECLYTLGKARRLGGMLNLSRRTLPHK